MARHWLRGLWIGAIVGIILISIWSALPNTGTSYCVQGLNFDNFICSLKATSSEFGTYASFESIPSLFTINIASLSGMGEIAVLPINLFLFAVDLPLF